MGIWNLSYQGGDGGLEYWLQRCWELRAGQSCRGGREGGELLLCDGEGSPEDLASC